METNDRLQILQVSPSDVGGGAERVAADLHLGLLARGQHSTLALGADHGTFPHSLQIPNDAMRSPWARAVLKASGLFGGAEPPDMPPALRRAVRFVAEPARYARVLRGHEDFHFPATRTIPDLTPVPPDVIHLHNLHGAYFDIRQLPALAARAPVVLTMHDTWLLTGHCAYPMTCEGWKTGCLACPHTSVYVPIHADAARQNYELKHRAVREAGIRIAAPSTWLMAMVEASGLADSLLETRVIPNGVDTAIFNPADRAAARASLGIPADRLVIMSAARSASASQFKGYDVLEATLQRLASRPLGARALVLVVGQQRPDAHIGGIPVHSVPFVEDRAALAAYYRAADIYVHPARAEAFGLTVLEAMACGTPVVASRAGGIPEVVHDGVSGLLAPVADADSMAPAIEQLATDAALARAVASAGVARAGELTLERQVDAYLSWYRQIAASTAL